MFKLFSIAALALSAAALPFLTSATAVETFETPSFEEAYVAPEIDSLRECGGADLPVFFHDNYITTHSAEYISESILASLNCDDIKVEILPVVAIDSTDKELEMSVAQVTELQDYLAATGTASEILSPRLVTAEDSLFLNGRTAIVQISSGESIQS